MIFSCVSCQEELSPTGPPFVALRCKHLYCIECTRGFVAHRLACPLRCSEDRVLPGDVEPTDMTVGTTSPDDDATVITAHIQSIVNNHHLWQDLLASNASTVDRISTHLPIQVDTLTSYSQSFVATFQYRDSILSTLESNQNRLVAALEEERRLDYDIHRLARRLELLRRRGRPTGGVTVASDVASPAPSCDIGTAPHPDASATPRSTVSSTSRLGDPSPPSAAALPARPRLMNLSPSPLVDPNPPSLVSDLLHTLRSIDDHAQRLIFPSNPITMPFSGELADNTANGSSHDDSDSVSELTDISQISSNSGLSYVTAPSAQSLSLSSPLPNSSALTLPPFVNSSIPSPAQPSPSGSPSPPALSSDYVSHSMQSVVQNADHGMGSAACHPRKRLTLHHIDRPGEGSRKRQRN